MGDPGDSRNPAFSPGGDRLAFDEMVALVLGLVNALIRPIVAGLAYEAIRFAGRHETNPVIRVVMAPGLALQWMTTKHPDSSQIEVAIAALEKIIELEPQDRPPVKGVEVMA